MVVVYHVSHPCCDSPGLPHEVLHTDTSVPALPHKAPALGWVAAGRCPMTPAGFAAPLLSPVYFVSLGLRVLWFPVWRWCLESSAQAGAQLSGLEPGVSSFPSHGCVLAAQIYFRALFVGTKEPDKKYVFNSNITNECRRSWYQPLNKSRGGMSIICLLPASLNWLSFRGGKKPWSLLSR